MLEDKITRLFNKIFFQTANLESFVYFFKKWETEHFIGITRVIVKRPREGNCSLTSLSNSLGNALVDCDIAFTGKEFVPCSDWSEVWVGKFYREAEDNCQFLSRRNK